MNNMLRTFKERRDSDEGFTLIELMVVVLIIGILLAIAVPTFLNAQNNAKAKAATSNLRTALSAVKTVFADAQSYDVTTTQLQAAEPSLAWTADTSSEPEQIGYKKATAAMSLTTKSKLGFCYYVYDDVSGSTTSGTYYGKADATTPGACTAVGTTATPTVGTSGAIDWAKDTKGAGW